MQQPTRLGDGHDSARIWAALCHRVRALQRIDGNVQLRSLAPSDALADEEHRRFIALAFSDDDHSVEARVLHGLPHSFDRCLIGLVVVAVAHPVCRGDRRGLRYPYQLEARRAIDGNAFERRRCFDLHRRA